ncbi:chorismate synthase [Desulfopila inferna]|uniref:chorismate synthase n=1 Tax=Desulfopila inferna TaxID=468528 RepID=UPI0019628FD0|nr:chorismate synthase [Desulfopila inferna]MBM9603142.1 chorismate synthase [Desulfopila inferna]
MNSFGTLFRVSIFGESHGIQIGAVIDGCPAGISLAEQDLQDDFSRRKAGGRGTTPRVEPDLPRIVSGVFRGKTTGAPITIVFENTNTQSKDYENLLHHPRPGHADFTAQRKYGGYSDPRGGGHFSGRITLGIVAAGVIAKKIMEPARVNATLIEAGGSKDISAAVEKALAEDDSIGGLIECSCTGMPAGLGEPFFNSVESMIAHMIFSVPATRGIEFGSGFSSARMKGSEHNDNLISADGKTESNFASGVNGGITNGNDIVFRVPVKPTSSVSKPQHTYNFQNQKIEKLVIEGRHDACIALRIPVVIECATAIALADLMLLEQKRPRVF